MGHKTPLFLEQEGLPQSRKRCCVWGGGGGQVQPGPEDSSPPRFLRPSDDAGILLRRLSELRPHLREVFPDCTPSPTQACRAPLLVSPSPVSSPSAGGMGLWTLFEAQAGGVGKGVGLSVD